MISFISTLEIIVVVGFAKTEGLKASIRGHVPDQNIFLWITASVVDAAAVYPNGIKKLLPSGLSAFLFKGNLVFSNGPKSLPRNPSDCPILYNWVFDNCLLAEELFAKALRSLETCVLAWNYNTNRNNTFENPLLYARLSLQVVYC